MFPSMMKPRCYLDLIPDQQISLYDHRDFHSLPFFQDQFSVVSCNTDSPKMSKVWIKKNVECVCVLNKVNIY